MAEALVSTVLKENYTILETYKGNWSALSHGIVNRVQAYISPKLFGGTTAKTPVGGSGVEFPHQGFSLGKTKITALDQDILIEGELMPCSQE